MGESPPAVASTAGPRPEIQSLTSLRGYLALWVVVYHFWNDVLVFFPGMDFLSPLARVGNLAVPAFFMLSGFVLAYNYGDRFAVLRRADVVRFLSLRLARIYPVHLVTLLAVLAMLGVSHLLGHQVTAAGYTARDFVLNLLLVHTWVPDFDLSWNFPSWSISSEWFAYILFPFAAHLLQRWLTTPRRAAVFAVLSLVASIGLMFTWQGRAFYSVMLVVPTFFAGAAVWWMLRDRLGEGATRGRVLPELLALAIFAACFQPSGHGIVASLLVGYFLLIVALAWCGAGCHRIWTAPAAVFLGEVSYSLYMTHTLPLKLVNAVLPAVRFQSAGIATKLGLLALDVVLVVACCLASYFLVERPCRQFFKNRLARRPAKES